MSKLNFKTITLTAVETLDGYRIMDGDKYVADVYGEHGDRLVVLLASAPDLMRAASTAHRTLCDFIKESKSEPKPFVDSIMEMDKAVRKGIMPLHAFIPPAPVRPEPSPIESRLSTENHQLRESLKEVLGHSNCFCPTCAAISEKFWNLPDGRKK